MKHTLFQGSITATGSMQVPFMFSQQADSPVPLSPQFEPRLTHHIGHIFFSPLPAASGGRTSAPRSGTEGHLSMPQMYLNLGASTHQGLGSQ